MGYYGYYYGNHAVTNVVSCITEFLVKQFKQIQRLANQGSSFKTETEADKIQV